MTAAKSRYLNIVIPPLPETYCYQEGNPLTQELEPGFQVEVPLGKGQRSGYVIGETLKDEILYLQNRGVKIRSIHSEGTGQRCFLPGQLHFFQSVAEYYGSSLSSVIDIAIPRPISDRIEKFFFLKKTDQKIQGSKQKKIIQYIEQNSDPDTPVSYKDITKHFPGSSQSIRSLEKRGILESATRVANALPFSTEPVPEWAKRNVTLNREQQHAVETILPSIKKHHFSPTCLHGVTGSGKTEVYIELIQQALDLKRQALVIVPEIALTPQLIDRFRARLGNEIAVLHSGLSQRDRWNSWKALLENRTAIAIGARSAIFAPLHNPGLFIVDEEHDSSFKQNDGLRYNGRDLALLRGKMENVPVILGSATPSLETYHRAHTKKYHYLPLPERHKSGSTVAPEIIDLRKISRGEMVSDNLSFPLYTHLERTLNNKEQAFLLYNRRGFANYLQCSNCDTVLECPNCSVTLTFHQSSKTLICHYCNLSTIPPEHCTECSPEDKDSEPGIFIERGSGTEKIHEEVQQLFPEARVERLDRDVAGKIEIYRDILSRFRNREIDILVGTQMIAKGHDLPGVTLIGVLDGDIGLHFPDFRASERTFQLLTQVAGRAGRGETPGRICLQTRAPHHPAIRHSVCADFQNFAIEELRKRKTFEYPPYSRILRVIASSQQSALPSQILQQYRSILQKHIPDTDLTILGPSQAPLRKVKTLWRWHMIIRRQSAKEIHQILNLLKSLKVRSSKVKMVFDVDPQDML